MYELARTIPDVKMLLALPPEDLRWETGRLRQVVSYLPQDHMRMSVAWTGSSDPRMYEDIGILNPKLNRSKIFVLPDCMGKT